jgi:hypothetical protein
LFTAFYKAAVTDPGYKKPDSEKHVKTLEVCKKCGYNKEHLRINHCSMCGFCVENLDHHCYFVNNCIAKGNMRYFLQFTAWGVIILLFGLVHVCYKFYHENSMRQIGFQSFYDMVEFVLPSFSFPAFYQLFNGDMDVVKYFDFLLIQATISLTIFCSIFMVNTFMNTKRRTTGRIHHKRE